MDIKSTTSPDSPRNVGGSPAKPGGAEDEARPQAAPTASADRVSLTAHARTLLTLSDQPHDAPVDASRVEALRLEVAEGKYRPDAARIADALIRLETGR